MDIHKIVNIICLICGIAVFLFGVIIRMGFLPHIIPPKGMVLIILGGVIILWSAVSMWRRR